MKRCAPGERATALPRPPTTGRAPTHADAAAKRSNDYKPENGPRRRLSSICTGAGRRPSPTPSAAPKRSGVNAVDIRTRARASPSVNGSAEGRRALLPIVPRGGATPRARGRLSAAVGCTEPTIRGSPAVTATRSARLSQPWQSDHAAGRGQGIAASPKHARGCARRVNKSDRAVRRPVAGTLTGCGRDTRRSRGLRTL